ncbi:MAG: beta-galactosidase [Prevotella sp.]|nr:beta-galactosidase [Prevotella sp.]
MKISIKRQIAFVSCLLGTVMMSWAADVPSVSWDATSLIIDSRRVCPVMGEIHYSRIPQSEWQQEVRKMKDGGVTIIATYVFWNHVEEQQGIFRWDGQRDLRQFLEVCKTEQMPVVLRIGPFCHGEVRCGGIPDWMYNPSLTLPEGEETSKPIRMRSEDPRFLFFVERLYRQIFTQVQGLQWKDGGPVMACQFDNEYRGRGSYLMALKRIATSIGFDLPFYTRTGWPELATPVPYGEMLPLYGDYADGFWERSLAETAGSYYKAFNFRAPSGLGENMGALDTANSLPAGENRGIVTPSPLGEGRVGAPYFTCELGGGMMTAYHRRPYLYPEDAYSMALVKLGSGSNLLGYYMYHGGTNPDGQTWLNEMQRTLATNYNDMPVKNYDFQAPLGEFGQKNPHYYMLRPLHLFMHDYAELLAPMAARFPCEQDIAKGDDSHLRWSVREKDGSGFIFINNYERLQNLSTKRDVQLEACGVKLPKLTIPAGTMCVLPVNIDGIRYATAQLVAKRNGKIYMQQIKGIPTTIVLENGKTLRNVKARGTEKPVWQNIYLLSQHEAEHLFLDETPQDDIRLGAVCEKIREAGPLRTISMGVNKVAEEPTDEDFEQAAVYRIRVPNDAVTKYRRLLQIDYRGDVARLYCNGQLIADNFYNGRPMLFGLWRLPAGATELELRILPLQENMPVYFPREADTTPGEQVNNIIITYQGL